jgi:DNA invertase Pin-like site-specific DNA recombinase
MLISPADLNGYDRFYRANLINSLSGFKSASLIGTKNNQSKFTKENLNELKNMYESGVKKGTMALHFDVSDTTIYRIFSGKTYTKELA